MTTNSTPAQAGAELPELPDPRFTAEQMRAYAELARRGGSDGRVRNEAFNLADTVIEHMQCGREQEARAAIMEAFRNVD